MLEMPQSSGSNVKDKFKQIGSLLITTLFQFSWKLVFN